MYNSRPVAQVVLPGHFLRYILQARAISSYAQPRRRLRFDATKQLTLRESVHMVMQREKRKDAERSAVSHLLKLPLTIWNNRNGIRSSMKHRKTYRRSRTHWRPRERGRYDEVGHHGGDFGLLWGPSIWKWYITVTPKTLQVNIGKLCNLTCHHCHVESGPTKVRENMDSKVSFR